jgi:hypothetical protein
MKCVLTILMIATLVSSLVGCEQAQQALDTVDKAKSFKDDIEKKANEVKEKALELIPGSGGEGSSEKEGGGKDQGNDKHGKEKDE